jgi:PIN domain nuclease of toxin-antitoxin system
MKLLLDTHAFLWWLIDDGRLSRMARETIMSADNAVYVSAVTGWEVATKHRLGKLPEADAVIARLPEITVRAGIETLPLEFSHGVRSGNYRNSHGDPFDRMLAAQAEIEGLTLVTRDPVFRNFPVKVLW